MVPEELVEEDRLVSEDKRSMEEIQKIGGSTLPMIQLDSDFSNKNLDNKLHYLDLKGLIRETGCTRVVQQDHQCADFPGRSPVMNPPSVWCAQLGTGALLQAWLHVPDKASGQPGAGP